MDTPAVQSPSGALRATHREQVLAPTTARRSPANTALRDRRQSQRPRVVWSRVHEVSTARRGTEDGRVAVPGAGRQGQEHDCSWGLLVGRR